MWQPTLGGRRFQTTVSFFASLRKKNAPGLERSLGRGRACRKPPSLAPRRRGPAQAQVWRLSTSEEHSLAQWSVQTEHSAAGYQQCQWPSSPLLLSFQGITDFAFPAIRRLPARISILTAPLPTGLKSWAEQELGAVRVHWVLHLILAVVVALDVGGRNEALRVVALPHARPPVSLVLLQDLHLFVFAHRNRPFVCCCRHTNTKTQHDNHGGSSRSPERKRHSLLITKVKYPPHPPPTPTCVKQHTHG